MKNVGSGIDKTFVRRGKIAEIGNDFEYWQTKTPIERLEAAQMIRQEYNDWKYGPGQRLQRVCSTTKRK